MLFATGVGGGGKGGGVGGGGVGGVGGGAGAGPSYVARVPWNLMS